MCRLAWQLLGMLGNVLGLLGMLRNVLGMLCNVLGMLATSSASSTCFPQGPRSPTSKINPLTCCLISCEAKGVVYHQALIILIWEPKAMLGVQTVEPLPSLVFDWGHGRSSAASPAYGPPLHWKNESSQSPLPPYPRAPFSSLDQVVQSWMEELAEGHEEEI